ncbi:NHL repeat-containing protein [Leptospira sp. WS39.C2]
MENRFFALLFAIVLTFFSCNKPVFSNSCDYNSNEFFNSILLKAVIADSSPHCNVSTTLSLSGNIIGLTTPGMILRTSSGSELSVPEGATSFSIPIASGLGSKYTLSISNQPNTITCVIHNGSEGILTFGISQIQIICHSTTAKRVYGQLGSFTTTNNSPISSDSLASPNYVLTDASNVYVSDSANIRVLVYSGTNTTAFRVIGQVDFTSSSANTTSSQFTFPTGLAKDSFGLYIGDLNSYRVLYFEGTNNIASRVYGQTNFTNAVPASPAADIITGPYGMAVDDGGFYVVDTSHHRVLYFPNGSYSATRVYGQSSFIGNTTGSTATTLNSPEGVAVSSDGVYIADKGNNRVLFYPGTSTTATRVYGQPNLTANLANNGGIGAATLNAPGAVLPFGGDVWIVDTSNHRILLYSGTSTTASRVFGQSGNGSFTVSNFGASETMLNFPQSISINGEGIFVADSLNNRVIVY